jgi:hypothetical protein
MGRNYAVFRTVGTACGKTVGFSVYLFLLAWNYLRRLVSDIWHGSVKWGWFAVLLLGAVGMAGVGEYAGALVVGLLAIVSAASNYWHWATRSFWKQTRAIVFPAILIAAALLFFEVEEMRGTSQWSHIPKAWIDMSVAARLKVPEFPMRVWPPPSVPQVATEPSPPGVRDRPFSLHPLKEEKADIVLRIVGTKRFAVLIQNNSNVVLREPKYWVAMYNLTKSTATQYQTVPIPTFGGDWLRGHDWMGPQTALGLPNVESTISPNDILFGLIGATCPDCKKINRYWIYYVVDQGGWYAEMKEPYKEGEKISYNPDRVPTKDRVPISDY